MPEKWKRLFSYLIKIKNFRVKWGLMPGIGLIKLCPSAESDGNKKKFLFSFKNYQKPSIIFTKIHFQEKYD